jgi:hypothetical protein
MIADHCKRLPVFFVREDSPICKVLMEMEFMLKPGQVNLLSDDEYESLKEDILLLELGDALP